MGVFAVTQCVMLVGGAGTRLGALHANRPKPLAAISGRPFLELLVGEAARRGFTRIVLLAGYRSEQMVAFAEEVRASMRPAVEIELSIEPEPLGTAGAIRHARSRLDEQFLLLNGDSWFDFNWLDLGVAFSNKSTAVMALALRHDDDRSRFGTVSIDGESITRFRERGASVGGLMNGGVYFCRRAVLEELPRRGSLEADVLPMLAAGGRLMGRTYEGYFIDIGVPSALAEAQSAIPSRRRRPAAFFDLGSLINLDRGRVAGELEFSLNPGAADAIKLLNDRGYYVFAFSSENGGGRGRQEADLGRLYAGLCRELRQAGASIDDFRYRARLADSPAAPPRQADEGSDHRSDAILDILNSWAIDISRSFLIASRAAGMTAAAAGGMPRHLFTDGNLHDVVIRIARFAATA